MQSRYCDVACMMTALRIVVCAALRWSCICKNTARSVSFEANGKLLMGRKLVNVASELGFFSFGLTSA